MKLTSFQENVLLATQHFYDLEDENAGVAFSVDGIAEKLGKPAVSVRGAFKILSEKGLFEDIKNKDGMPAVGLTAEGVDMLLSLTYKEGNDMNDVNTEVENEEVDEVETEEEETSTKEVRVRQNGMVYPREGTISKTLWDIFDDVSTKKGAPAAIDEVLELARAEGIKDGSIRAGYAHWRKFYGITGRVMSEASQKKAEQAAADKAAKAEARAKAAAEKKAQKEAEAKAKAAKEADTADEEEYEDAE